MVNDDRGQLILIGALLVAATILGSITLLNTIHESPDVKTQQDARSLQDTERKMAEVRSNLERLFLYDVSVNETGEPLPYANSTFGDVVEEYERQSMNLSSKTSAGILNVTYLDGESLTGGIAKQNATDDGYRAFPTDTSNQTVIENAKTLPRMLLVVNETNTGFAINITNSIGDDVGLGFSASGELRKKPVGGTPTLVCSPPSGFDSETDGRIELDLINGSGSVTYVTGTGPDRREVEYCSDITFGPSLDPTLDVEFDNPGADPANGTFVITGSGGSLGFGFAKDDNRNYRTMVDGSPIVVNPKFEVRYQTPNVAYDSTFALYNSTAR
jgi:hypothetical protein